MRIFATCKKDVGFNLFVVRVDNDNLLVYRLRSSVIDICKNSIKPQCIRIDVKLMASIRSKILFFTAEQDAGKKSEKQRVFE